MMTTMEILESQLHKRQETMEDYYAQMGDYYARISEELHALRLLCRSRKGKKEDPEDQSLNDKQLVETEVATEPISHQVPVSKLEPSLRFHNASPVVCEDFKSLVGVDGLFDHVKARVVLLKKSAGVTINQVAHQLFDQMPSKEKQRKCLKAWKFKFKTTSKRSKSMDVKFFSVEEIAWLTKDSKEISRGCVNKEFKAAVAGCETKKQTLLIVKLANHVWKPGEFVHPKVQLDWLKRADSNHEKESNKKLRKLRILKGGKEQGRSTQVKLFKNWKFKYKHKHPLRILPCKFRGRKKSMCKLRPQQRLCLLEILERSMVPSLLSSVRVSRGLLHPNESDFIEWSELLFGVYLRRDNIQQKRRKEKGCQSRKFKFKMDFKPAGTSYLNRYRECGICAQFRGVKKQSKLLLPSLCPSCVCRAMLRVTVKQRKHPKSWSFKYKQHRNF